MRDYEIDQQTGLFLVKSISSTASQARQARRETGDGRARRIRRGVLTTAENWARLTAEERYLLEIRAVVETRAEGPVVSHELAAALWGIPVTDATPSSVHVTAEPGSNARSKNGVIVHREVVDDADVWERGGMRVTSPTRTVLDLARTRPFLDAVVALDHAFNPRRARGPVLVSLDELRERVDRAPSARGNVKATKAIVFARPNVDNPGESRSRVAIWELGFPDPVLQVQHLNPRGGYYYTDFEWPRFRLVGEFDGRGKYLKQEYLRHRTPGEAVYEEKIREDHIRSEGNRFARWGVPEVEDRRRLFRILTEAGLPSAR